MSDLTKYHDRVIEQRPANFEMPPESDSQSTSNMVTGVLRRWYLVLLVFFVMCGIGIPAIWFLIEPVYSVTGAIRVAPQLEKIYEDEVDRGEIFNYDSYMNTQAEIITSPRVVQRAADHLADKNLAFFESEPAGFVTKLKQTLKNTRAKPEPAAILKQAISNGIISAVPARRTELIKVTMKSRNKGEAKQIVDAFIDAYKGVKDDSSRNDDVYTLDVLEKKQADLAEKMANLRKEIIGLAKEFGSKSSSTMDKRQEIKLERVGMLLNEVTKWEAERIRLEEQVALLKDRLESPDANEKGKSVERSEFAVETARTVGPNDLTLSEYMDRDPTLIRYTGYLEQKQQEFADANQRYTPAHPELKKIKNAKKMWDESVKQRKAKLVERWNDYRAEKIAKAEEEKMLNAKKQLADMQSDLETARALEKRFKNMLAQEDTETINLGRRQLDIEKLQDELSSTKEMYKKIGSRIDELKMERMRVPRISVTSYAESGPVRDKRDKYSMALMFGSLACGMLLAFLRDKADLRLRTPDDVSKQIGIRIIGTTTSSDNIKRPLLPKQIAGDYQTIRANLRLLNGDKEPRMLVVTSPGMREGKTTFAINLATSMAGSGKKVLLIDGDLRKPDIAHMLTLPRGSRGLQDVLFGRKFERVVCSIPSIGLDVLTADARNRDDACELLALPGARQRINTISEKYDHVIIDTPPVLAFPDALVWAKMADAVILISFAGQTTAPDLREANEKLAQINVTVLGTILSNVRAGHSYYRYGPSYYARNTRSRENARRVAAKLLLPVKGRKDNNKDYES